MSLRLLASQAGALACWWSIEGALIDAMGAPIDGVVNATYKFQVAPCEVQEGRFSCESQSPYGATYTLFAQLGSTYMRREVTVPATDCALNVIESTFDLSARSCTATEPAIISAVQTRRGARVTVRASVDDGASEECTPGRAELLKDSQQIYYTCGALTPTGGGHYMLEVSDGTRTLQESVAVLDDGCNPHTARNELDLTRPASSR